MLSDAFFWSVFEVTPLLTYWKSIATPAQLRPQGSSRPQILFFRNISRTKDFREKYLRQKLFLIEIRIKKVSCKIFLELKITSSARAEFRTLCMLTLYTELRCKPQNLQYFHRANPYFIIIVNEICNHCIFFIMVLRENKMEVPT